MTSVQAMIFWEDRVELTKVEVKGDKSVQLSKTWRPSFKLDDFIPQKIKKSRLKFWGSDTIIQWLIFRQGLTTAVKPEGIQFSKYWTEEEARDHVNKMVSKANEEGKPFSWGQLIPIFIILGINLACVIYLVARVAGG